MYTPSTRRYRRKTPSPRRAKTKGHRIKTGKQFRPHFFKFISRVLARAVDAPARVAPGRRVPRVLVFSDDVQAVDLLELEEATRKDLDRGFLLGFGCGRFFWCGRGLLFGRRQIREGVEAFFLLWRFFSRRRRRYRCLYGLGRLDVDTWCSCEEPGALEAFQDALLRFVYIIEVIT